MMSNERSVRRAVELALMTGVAAFALSTPLHAQEQEQGVEDDVMLEEVLVTGSRIAGRSDITSATPVSVFGAEDIDAAGNATLEGFIQAQPYVTGGFLSSRVNNGNPGQATASLRGLGSGRTLILVDGHRVPPATTGASVDMNMIPLGSIDRVEVLRDGASTVYGSDAIAGVINFITKRDFDGVDLRWQYDVTDEGDGDINRLSMLTGASSERGSATFGVEYVDRKAIWQGDRGFSACPLGESGGEIRCIGSGTSYPAHIFPSTIAGDYVVDSDTDQVRPYTNDDTFNYAAVSYMVTPNEVFSIWGDGHWDLIQDGGFSSLSIFSNAMFSNRKSQQQMAPVGTFWAPLVPETNPGNPFDEPVFVARRLAEVSTGRFFTQDVSSFRVIAGLEGEFSNGWTWTVDYNYGRGVDTRVIDGQINQPRVETALDPALCAADPDCPKVWDPFRRDTLDQELQDYVIVTHSPVGRREQKIAQAVVTGDTGGFHLPAGDIQWVAGASTRRENAQFIPDGAAFLGQIYFVAGNRTEGRIKVDEFFAEVNVPLVADVPFVNYLSTNLSWRYSDYGGAIGSDDNFKGTIEWAPISTLRFRGTYAEGFRAPSIGELFLPQRKSAQQYNDPCQNYGAGADPTVAANCAAEGLPPDFSLTSTQATSLFGGNAELQPEQSESTSFGLVWTPEFANLSVRLDYFDIEITDAIGTAGTNNVIQSCWGSAGFTHQLCSLLEGPSAVGEAPHPTSPYRNAIGNIAGIILTNANLSTFNTSGVDFGLNYSLDGWGGRWDFSGEGTWLDKHDYLPFEGADLVQAAGFVAEDQWVGNPATFAEWQARFVIGYSRDFWGVSWIPRWIDSAQDIFASEANMVNSVPSIWYHDFQGWVNWKNFDFTLGVRNAFDEEPPYMTNYDDMNTIQFTYDTAGRYYYFRVGFRM
jgi:iron complex outermembrane receptor protein